MNNKPTLVIVSGYFNPLHSGHIDYFNKSKSLGDFLIVIINSDLQRKIKDSKPFMDEKERAFIVSNIKAVDFTIISIDNDSSVKATLLHIEKKYNKKYKLIFTNGGDQFFFNSAETKVCQDLNIQMVDGLGEKIQSSSWLLK
jgi:cytidyltransferase-like protein